MSPTKSKKEPFEDGNLGKNTIEIKLLSNKSDRSLKAAYFSQASKSLIYLRAYVKIFVGKILFQSEIPELKKITFDNFDVKIKMPFS